MVKFSEERSYPISSGKFDGEKTACWRRWYVAAKVITGNYSKTFAKRIPQSAGDGEVMDLKPRMQVDRYKIHDIELVVDRLAVN